VFPVEPYSKKPYRDVSSWSAWATCNVKEIRRNWPDDGANVGIAAKPSGLLIVDLDRHEDDGVAAFSELAARAHHEQFKCNREYCTGHWPDTYVVQTPTGGFHLYFVNPDPSRYGNSAGGTASCTRSRTLSRARHEARTRTRDGTRSCMSQPAGSARPSRSGALTPRRPGTS